MKPKSKKSSGGAQQFLVWHGEKIVVGIIIVVALWFAMQGLGYQALTWQPEELSKDADAADAAIKASTRNADDEGIEIFDFAEFAGQIRQPVPAGPYRAGEPWHPFPPAASGARSSQQGSGF